MTAPTAPSSPPAHDPERRGVRTLLWALLALAAAIPANAAAFGLDAGTVAKVGAVCAVITAVVTTVVNALEDAGYVPALLKAPASDGQNPVPDGDLLPGDH